MKQIAVLVVIFIQSFQVSFSQDSTNINNDDKSKNFKHELIEQNHKMQLLLRESERNFELAGKILDYSALFFAALVIFLGIAGWIGARRFREIDTTSTEMKEILEKMQAELAHMQKLKEENMVALEELKRKIESDSKSFMEIIFLMRQGEQMFEQGKLDEVINIYKKILVRKPNSAEAHFMIGIAYSSNSDTANAIHFLKKAINLEPNYDEALYELGKAFRRKGEFLLSIDFLKKAIDINPKHFRAIANIGYSYLKNNQLEEAIIWYKKAILIESDYPLPYLGIALINYKLGNTEESLKYYRLAKELLESLLQRGEFRFWDIYHLGEIYLIFGKLKEAKKYYRRAISMNPASENLRSIIYRLEILKSSLKPPRGLNEILQLLTTLYKNNFSSQHEINV